MPDRRLSKELLRPFAAELRARGFDALALGRRVGVIEPNAVRARPQLPAEIVERFVAEAAALASDPHLGLHAVVGWPRGGPGVLELAPPFAPTLRQALAFVVTYFPLARGWSRLELERAGPQQRLVFVSPDDELPSAFIAELEVSLFVRVLRGALGRDWAPHRVTFAQPAPGKVAPLAEFLGTRRIAWRQRATMLELPAELLSRPCLHPDPPLFEYLSRQAARELETLRVDLVPSYIREKLAALLGPQAPSVARLASSLHMSPRTLQRKLEQGGTTYQSLLDAVRAESAARLLLEAEVSVAELSERLGYSSARAFLRAFERWTGTTPGQWRRRGDVLR